MKHPNTREFCFLSISLVLIVLSVLGAIKINDISSKNIQLQGQLISSKIDNDQLKQQIQNLTNQVNQLSTENKNLKTITLSLTSQQNSMIQTLSEVFQAGYLKPTKVGYTPIFRFTIDEIDKNLQQQTLANLSQGSYSFKQEVVTFSFDDMNSWSEVGDWHLTGYRAISAECGNDLGITASGNLATPGFTLGVDPKIWPYGTIFYIEDFGFAIAADCGGGVGGSNRGDFLVASDIAYFVTGGHKVWLVYKPTT